MALDLEAFANGVREYIRQAVVPLAGSIKTIEQDSGMTTLKLRVLELENVALARRVKELEDRHEQ